MREAEALAIVAAGLRRKKRAFNLVTVARAIEFLAHRYGSKSEVARRAQVTVNMLNKFLAVARLTPEVREMVQRRKVDRVMDVFLLSKLQDPKAQVAMAGVVAERGLTTLELREAVRLLKNDPSISVNEAVRVVKTARREVQRIFAVVMPLVPQESHAGKPQRFSMTGFSELVPNRGVRLSKQAAIVFFDEDQYNNAKALAKKRKVSVSDLARTLMGNPAGGG